MKKLLLCEDDNHIALLVEFTVEDVGFEVERYANGSKAAARLAEPPMPDIVVLDLMLPGMNGIEILREVKADPARASTPVVILSARAKDADRAQAVESGASAYLTKPFNPAELIATLERLTGPSSD
jgi:DNA-binding response OmpR family regulator